MKASGFEGELKNQVGLLLKRVQQAFRSKMDNALAGSGLTTPQYAVLAHLRETPGLSNAELARRSFVAAPTMIRIVQDLETLGFIERKGNKNHKRVIDMVLTPKGEKVLGVCDSKVDLIQKQMVSGLKDKEVANLSKLLVHCAERLESIPE